jgi:hypothetical protein
MSFLPMNANVLQICHAALCSALFLLTPKLIKCEEDLADLARRQAEN